MIRLLLLSQRARRVGEMLILTTHIWRRQFLKTTPTDSPTEMVSQTEELVRVILYFRSSHPERSMLEHIFVYMSQLDLIEELMANGA